MARIFVSGQISDVEYVRNVQDTFVVAGHRITHDWTRNEDGDVLLAGDKAKFDNPEEELLGGRLPICKELLIATCM